MQTLQIAWDNLWRAREPLLLAAMPFLGEQPTAYSVGRNI